MRWDYQCLNCGHVQEFAKRQPSVCPLCGSTMVWKPGSVSFVVKGFNAKNGYSDATKKA